MSDSAVPGSLGFGAVLPGGSALKASKAVADDASIETRAHRRGDPAGFAIVVKRFGPVRSHIRHARTRLRDLGLIARPVTPTGHSVDRAELLRSERVRKIISEVADKLKVSRTVESRGTASKSTS